MSFEIKWLAAKDIIENFTETPFSLEQIIDVCHARQPRKTALQLFSLMRTQIAMHHCSNYLNNLSFKELWFTYYMLALYGRAWDQDKKQWYNIDR